MGRGPELEILGGALRRRPAVIMVEGEAGIGKSRLLRETAAAEAARGSRTLMTACHPLRAPFPFGPVLDALRRTGDWLPPPDELNPVTGELLPLLPELTGHLPMPSAGAADPRTERVWCMQAVRALLEAAGPVTLMVEDLQWADEATRDLLLMLARDPPNGLALVLTYRRDKRRRGVPVLGTAYRRPPGISGAEIQLKPLTESDMQQMATAALGPRATPRLVRVLFERSAGLPLVAEEDLITLYERGRSSALFNGAPSDDDDVAGLESSEVPRGLREAVSERVAGLSEAGMAVVQAAAVLAVPAPEALLAEVADLDPEKGTQGLLESLRSAVLIESSPTLYGFRHALDQQAVYRGTVGPRRLELHRRAIKALWAQNIPPLVEIAHHTRALGDRQAWLEQAHAASDQAIALGDEGTAAGILREMLAERSLDPQLRSRAALDLSRIAVNSVDYAATVTALRQIVADPQLHPATRGEIRLNLGLLMYNQATDPYGLHEVEQAVTELEQQRPELAARAMAALAVREGDEPVAEALAWLERAERIMAVSGSRGARAAVHASRISLDAYLGDPEVWQRLDALPRDDDDLEVVRQTARALYNAAEGALLVGHDERAAALLGDCGRLARRVGSLLLDCYSRSTLLVHAYLAGEWAGLEEKYSALRTEFPDMPFLETQRALVCGRLAAARGQLARATEEFTSVAESWSKRGGVYMCITLTGLARARLTDGDAEAAWSVTASARHVVRQKQAWVWAVNLLPVSVEAAVTCGRHREAVELTDEMERGLAGRDAPAAVAELHLCRGILRREADPAAAAEHFDQAAAIYRSIGRPYEEAGAVESTAHVLTGTDPGRAASGLTAAADLYARLGAAFDAARCQERLRALGLSRPSARGRPGYGDALSPREHEVAQLLARGASNKEIAQALFLSPRTVEHHVAHTLTKLGVKSRDAVRGALDRKSREPRTPVNER
ncbi:AAA family ATPase [Streptomyces actinomycinicus]|uniref:AAA family ATPase n=1 Tax=Streptomyces actinomycinicus TaxID=1695166 RepID=A0A937EQ84_9ACTN|nr:AAA family ATPase [Streptomyces actinomycinicus]MBL1087562.1 AAA family ATPase [Streptomyces actinomycinicus]